VNRKDKDEMTSANWFDKLIARFEGLAEELEVESEVELATTLKVGSSMVIVDDRKGNGN